MNWLNIDESADIKTLYYFTWFSCNCCLYTIELYKQNYRLLQRNIMNLPIINNRNSKQPTKGSYPLAQSAPSLQQFGLGIQVFKIQASKGLDNHAQPRKIMKNIENPVNKQPLKPIKRTQVLPSLSCEKKEKAALSETDFLQRRTAVERKKPSIIVDTIKQVQQKQPFFKKISNSAQKIIKSNIAEQPSIPAEPQIVQRHYRTSFNDIINFYADLKQNETQNLKQIKRIRKMKENADEEQLQKAMRLRNNKSEMVKEMVDRQNLDFSSNEQIYDEFQISTYMDNGQKFKFQDQDIPMPDYDDNQ